MHEKSSMKEINLDSDGSKEDCSIDWQWDIVRSLKTDIDKRQIFTTCKGDVKVSILKLNEQTLYYISNDKYYLYVILFIIIF